MHYSRLLILALLILQGCNTAPQTVPVTPVAETPPPAPLPAKKAPAMQVSVLVSENTPAYTDVARELSKLLGQRSATQLLSTSQLKNQNIVSALKSAENTQVVSIGLNASIATKTLGNKAVVFCQVFNYQEYGLVTPRHKGISMLPAPQQIFRTWRNLSSTVTDIGVITGPGFEDVIETARAAAKLYLINLHHETVKSDKELQFAYKKMSKHVQGFWLLPDNRVLSGNSLREIMNYSVLNSKMVAVFNEELLKLGGLFSITPDPHDIAVQVYERLEQAAGKDMMPGPDIVYPEKFKLRVNAVMANNLGLEIPEQYKRAANAH